MYMSTCLNIQGQGHVHVHVHVHVLYYMYHFSGTFIILVVDVHVCVIVATLLMPLVCVFGALPLSGIHHSSLTPRGVGGGIYHIDLCTI